MVSKLGGSAGGGSEFNSKDKDKNNNKSKTKGNQDSKVKEYFVYKYNRNIPLAEQIILGNKSVFLQITQDGTPITHVKLDLRNNPSLEEQDIILSPHQDGVNGVASYTLPIKFRDHKEIKEYIVKAKHHTIDSLYLEHKALWSKFVASNDENVIRFLAIDSVYDHFQDLFETTHYDLVDGVPGSGKGATLITFQLLGYRVVLAADYSGANLLDLYGCNGRCQITVAEDELDDIENDDIKRKIYKVGYDIAGKTTRTLDGNTSNRRNRLYEVFGLKIFGTEIPPDNKILGGFNDRYFRIPSIKGKPLFRVKKVLLEMEKPTEKQNPKYSKIVKQVEEINKLTFIFRMLHHEDMIEEVETNIDGRPLELTGPQIYLFASKELGSSYGLSETKEEKADSLLINEILPTLSYFLQKKGQLTERTIQSVMAQALTQLKDEPGNDRLIHKTIECDISTGKKTELVQIAYDLIYDRVKSLTEGKDPMNLNEQAIYSAEYGKITHRDILKICKNMFRGEYGKIHNTQARIDIRSMTFDKETIQNIGNNLKAITKIEILEEQETSSGTEGRNYSLNGEKDKKQDSDTKEPSEDQQQRDFSISTEEADNMKERQDYDTNNKNNTEARNEDKEGLDKETITSVYTSTASNSVPPSPEEPITTTDPDMAMVGERLRNLKNAGEWLLDK